MSTRDNGPASPVSFKERRLCDGRVQDRLQFDALATYDRVARGAGVDRETIEEIKPQMTQIDTDEEEGKGILLMASLRFICVNLRHLRLIPLRFPFQGGSS